jgi:hypothetical protein
VVIFVVAGVVAGVGMAVLQTGWAKDRLRALIERQANPYLTANLRIGRLGGSLFRGLELGDITLSRDGAPIIEIDAVSVSYSPRELYQNGTVIRRLVVTRPRIVAARLPDGRWDLGALVKRDARQQDRAGPRRAIEIQEIEVVDASVSLRDPLKFGVASPDGAGRKRGCPSSTAATRRARTASCPSRAAPSAAVPSTTSSRKRRSWRRPASARSRCSART